MSGRQFIKFLLIFSFVFTVCYGLLLISDGAVATVFDEILTVFLYVATLIAAMSYVMFTYVDNIAKEVTELRNEVMRPAYAVAQQKFSNLKKEVLYNGGFIFCLYLFELSIKGVSVYLLVHLPAEHASLIAYVSGPV